MKIYKYGITLTRLKEEHIELVRSHRNSDSIKSFMRYREWISPEAQKIWFNSINNYYNYYFIISINDEYIGLINGSHLNFENRTSEGGIFIWNKEYENTIIPSLCSIMLNDCNFIINEFEASYITVLNSNIKVITYNKLLGYLPCQDIRADAESSWYVLTKERYLKVIDKLRKSIAVSTNDSSPLAISDINFDDDTQNDLIQLYKPLPDFMRVKVEVILNKKNRSLYL